MIVAKNLYAKYMPEINGSIICVVLGMLSGYLSQSGDSAWYLSLVKPSFNPPSYVFGPVWTVLYVFMGIVLGQIWRSREHNKLLLVIFMLQLACNILWSPLFFYFHRIDLALIDLCVLWVSVFIIIILAFKNRLVLILFTAYLIWLSYALLLNSEIYRLN